MGKPVDARKELFKESQKRHRRRQKTWLILFGVVVVVFLVCIFFVVHWNGIRIKQIVITGNKVVSTEAINQTIQAHLTGSTALIIPNDNSLFLNLQVLGQNLITSFPDIEKVALTRQGFSRLAVAISERSPKLLWCVQGSDGDKCFYADDSGFLYALAPDFSDNVLFKVYGLISDNPIGTRPLSRTNFSNLLTTTASLPGLLKNAGISPAVPRRLTITSAGDCTVLIAEESASSTAEASWNIIFNRSQNLDELSSNLNTVFNAPEFKADALAHANKFDYIDLRFGKKVFYKFK